MPTTEAKINSRKKSILSGGLSVIGEPLIKGDLQTKFTERKQPVPYHKPSEGSRDCREKEEPQCTQSRQANPSEYSIWGGCAPLSLRGKKRKRKEGGSRYLVKRIE